MTKREHQTERSNADGTAVQKALLFEVAGAEYADQGKAARSLRVAALSLEEIIRYMRFRYSRFEIAEIKVVGPIDVLSSSEHLG
jgi:hypothetical protein